MNAGEMVILAGITSDGRIIPLLVDSDGDIITA